MENNNPPAPVYDRFCYIELPATDIQVSAAFYGAVFNWNIRQRSDGHQAFDDGSGRVSGTWRLGRPPATTPGLMVYIMVQDINTTIKAIERHGGKIVQPLGMDAPEITARFSDPAGNVLGIFQE